MEKIIFTGPMGAGKTTAIAAISEIHPIATDVRCSDDGILRKPTTTVAMDYGYFTIEEGSRIHLYGTPGQERFNYMWTILSQGGIGLVLLVDNASPNPLADMNFYLESFKEFIQTTAVAIGVTRMDISRKVTIDDYRNELIKRERIFPVFEIDARQPNDVKILVLALLAILQV